MNYKGIVTKLLFKSVSILYRFMELLLGIDNVKTEKGDYEKI